MTLTPNFFSAFRIFEFKFFLIPFFHYFFPKTLRHVIIIFVKFQKSLQVLFTDERLFDLVVAGITVYSDSTLNCSLKNIDLRALLNKSISNSRVFLYFSDYFSLFAGNGCPWAA